MEALLLSPYTWPIGMPEPLFIGIGNHCLGDASRETGSWQMNYRLLREPRQLALPVPGFIFLPTHVGAGKPWFGAFPVMVARL